MGEGYAVFSWLPNNRKDRDYPEETNADGQRGVRGLNG